MQKKIKIDEQCGAKLRALRLNAGLSQEKICAELQLNGCDIGRTTYAKYENGNVEVKASVINTLAKIHKCTVEELLSKPE